ncbi:MAG TPA: hypothetical protein VKM55_23505 [Candidatus Lokiarchaeia archaeon]|nr:hypothetical protein [Candidatus Lokiarchaeia archaeon]
MEKPLEGQGNDIKCPSCGLVIKITAPALASCPVCGASLPELSPSQKLASKNVPKMISLEQALSSKTRSRDSWSFKELLNVFVLTAIITLMAKFIFLSFWLQGSPGSELTFNPAFVIVTYLTGMIAGIIPIVYVLHYKLSVEKIGWKKLVHKQWGEAILLGAACGVLLYLCDVFTTAINEAIYSATGWSLFSQSDTFQLQYNAFLASNFPWNKLLIVVFLGAQLLIAEIFLRGTIVNGALQVRKGHESRFHKATTRLQALAISIGFNTLFMFTTSFFDVTSIVFDVLANLILALLFILAKNVQSCMIAELVYVILIFIIIP